MPLLGEAGKEDLRSTQLSWVELEIWDLFLLFAGGMGYVDRNIIWEDAPTTLLKWMSLVLSIFQGGWKWEGALMDGHQTGHQPRLEPNSMKGHHISCSLVPQSQSYLLDQKEEMALKLIRNLRGPLRFKSFPCPPFLIYKKQASLSLPDLPWVPKGRFKQRSEGMQKWRRRNQEKILQE